MTTDTGDLFSYNNGSERITHLDLFSGIGGFALALDQVVNAEHTFVEYEKHLQTVIKKHWPTSEIHGDIETFTPSFSPFLITGGFPCQDISRANTNSNKKGIYGNRSGLWSEYHRVIKEASPRYCIIENVYDLLGNGLGRILQDLSVIGYDAAWTVIDSQYTGVPQRRRRVYILAVRDGIPRGTDIFKCGIRSSQSAKAAAKSIKESRTGVFESPVGEGQAVAYFTKQRSDEYNECGVGSTITKRDWKSNTDLILQKDGTVRGLTVEERLAMQGIPDTWLDGCDLSQKQRYAANGMTIPAVKWVMQQLFEYHETLDI